MALHRQQRYLSLRRLIGRIQQRPPVEVSSSVYLSYKVLTDIHLILGIVDASYGDILYGMSEVPSYGNILEAMSLSSHYGVRGYGLSGAIVSTYSSIRGGISQTGYFGNEYEVEGGEE